MGPGWECDKTVLRYVQLSVHAARIRRAIRQLPGCPRITADAYYNTNTDQYAYTHTDCNTGRSACMHAPALSRRRQVRVQADRRMSRWMRYQLRGKHISAKPTEVMPLVASCKPRSASVTGLQNGGESCLLAVDKTNPKRRISIHTDKGIQHYAVVSVERTTVANTYKLHIDSHGAACLQAGSHDATIWGKQEVSGSLALID